jgi:hypothetical protein
MKLLFLDVDMRYMNPTRALIPGLLRECGATVFYGPGYQPPAVLQHGLQAFIDREGPFDFVVGNDFTVLYAEMMAAEPWRLDNHQMRAPRQSLLLLRDIADSFRRYRGPKIVFLLECDGHHLTKEQIARLEDPDAYYVVLWDQRLMAPIRDCPDLRHEPFASRATDNFFEFVVANDHRIIAMPHFVADSEFEWGTLADRKYQWFVPGARYYYRTSAREVLARAGLLSRQFPWMPMYGLLARIGIKPYANPLLLALYGAQFNERIASSRFAYTCGSALYQHIRKHFEIPSKGTVLITAPIRGFDAMGFVDGVNCFVRMPADLVALHRELDSDPARAQAVASAGRDLVWSRHRAQHRTCQLRASLEAICRGHFAGCGWNNGNWEVRSA